LPLSKAERNNPLCHSARNKLFTLSAFLSFLFVEQQHSSSVVDFCFVAEVSSKCYFLRDQNIRSFFTTSSDEILSYINVNCGWTLYRVM
jgi:hypothetical protein